MEVAVGILLTQKISFATRCTGSGNNVFEPVLLFRISQVCGAPLTFSNKATVFLEWGPSNGD